MVQSLLVDALHYPHDAIDSLPSLWKEPRDMPPGDEGPWSYEDVNIAIQVLGFMDEHQHNQSLHAAQGTSDQIFQCGLGFSPIMGLFNRIVAEIPESYADQVTGPDCCLLLSLILWDRTRSCRRQLRARQRRVSWRSEDPRTHLSFFRVMFDHLHSKAEDLVERWSVHGCDSATIIHYKSLGYITILFPVSTNSVT